MGLSKRAARLRDTAPFDSLDDDSLERAAGLADEVWLPAGYLLVDDDDRRDHLLVIAAGTASVLAPDGVDRTLGPGTAIGTVSAVGWHGRRERIVASTPMRLFMFDTDGLAELLTDHPELLPPWGATWAGSPRRSSRRSTEG